MFELFLIRAEAYTAMGVDGGVGPYLQHIFGAGHLHDAAEEYQGPRGYTGEDTYILFAAGLGHEFDFLVPFGQQGGGEVGGEERPAYPGQVVEHNSGDVAVSDIRVCCAGDTAGQHEVFISEYAEFRVAVIEEGQGVPAGAGVRMVQVFGGDGDKLALVGGGSRRFGKPGDEAGPEDIGLSFHHAADVVADGIVVADRDLTGEVVVIFDGWKSEFLAGFGAFALLDQGFEGGVLEAVDVFFTRLQPGIQVRKVV